MEKKLKDRLRTARGAYSQKNVAEMLGVQQQSYARYESGSAAPSLEKLQQICCVLNVSADYLLGLIDEPMANLSTPVTSPGACPTCEVNAARLADAQETVKTLTRTIDRLTDALENSGKTTAKPARRKAG